MESWNDADDASVSIARARVLAGETTKLHRVREVIERYLITSGAGTVFVGDLKPVEVNVGDVVVIPPGVSQKIACTGSQDLVFYCICSPRFRPEFYEELP